MQLRVSHALPAVISQELPANTEVAQVCSAVFFLTYVCERMLAADAVVLATFTAVAMTLAAASRKARSHPAVWLLTFLAVALDAVQRWQSIDNHIYLAAYWALAVGASRFLVAGAREVALQTSARYLLALTMIVAALQKLVAPDYLDGRMLYVQLITDERLGMMARLLDLPTTDLMQENVRRLVEPHWEGGEAKVIPLVTGPEELRQSLIQVGRFVSLLTFVVELTVGVLFALPRRLASSGAAHLLLMGFMAATYTLLPIRGFGALLGILGLAASSRRYLVPYLGLIIYVYYFADVFRPGP